MDQEKIKNSFIKAKQDIHLLQSEINSLKQEISEIKQILISSTNTPTNQHIPSQTPTKPTNQHIPSQTPTKDTYLYGLKHQYIPISTRNEGVPTNQPTNQQTNQHTRNEGVPTLKVVSESSNVDKNDKISNIDRVSEILNSLDTLKKELRHKFKKLTTQEMSIFSAIYQLEEQGFVVDYSLLSKKLNISEISIRDYVRKLLSKNIPILKSKENNKKISLSISPELKKITTLSSIIHLRNI